MSAPDGVHPLLATRRSLRRFDEGHRLSREDLVPLLEAARWAPSAGNTQPTRWLVTLRGEPAHALLVGCLKPGNQPWAPRASALLVAVATEADETGRPYPFSAHDAGQAAAHLTLQAVAQGLVARQMGGFEPGQVHRAFGLTPRQRAAVVVAIGVAGGAPLPEPLAEREAAPRSRLPLSDLVLPT